MEQEKKITVDQAIKISNIILKANKNNMPMIEYVFSKSEFSFDEFKEFDFSAIEDTLGDYINEKYIAEKGGKVRRTEFENDYFDYCNLHDKKALKKVEIKVVMERLGYPLKKSGGYLFYRNLEVRWYEWLRRLNSYRGRKVT